MNALQKIIPEIRRRAGSHDRSGDWPVDDLAALASIGAMRWSVPADAGRIDLPALDLHLQYETLAAASLATALILSQRDSAVGLIDGAANVELRARLLADLEANRVFSTVGIAQTTTSRQGGAPALLATPSHGGFQLNGIIPWATGADRAQFVVVVSAVEGGGLLRFILPTDVSGLTIHPPMPLVALAASRTTAMQLNNVRIDSANVLTGPAEQMPIGRRKGLAIGQTFLAMGLCRSALDLIGEHRSTRAEEMSADFGSQLSAIRREVLNFCSRENIAPNEAPRLRGLCNDLAVRITHAAIALYKGTALKMDHPAQRLAREAMFLLVWSCPDPVIECTVELLARSAS